MYSLTVNLCRELQEASNRIDSTGDDKLTSKEFHAQADNFFRFMMDNFASDMTVMGARTALFRYDLALEPTELTTFDEFHERFGKSVAKAING